MIRRCVVPWLILTSMATTSLAAVFTVTTNADSGPGSLRQTIVDANANPGADAIHFNIGGGGPHVIATGGALPVLTDAVTIDGTTQPGFAGTPIITLDGPGHAAFGNGLTIMSASTIRGLVIVDFHEAGIEIHSPGATIVGNYIGIDASGTVARGNTDGIEVGPNVNNARLGGAAPRDRNVISGNRSSGILLEGSLLGGPTNVIVQGNFIGLNATGNAAVGNEVGIAIQGGDATRIGGALPGEGNVISGNILGIVIRPDFLPGFGGDDAIGNVVQGNRIGTDVTGTSAVPNRLGVYTSAKGTIIGGAGTGPRNIISGNSALGILVGVLCFSSTCLVPEDTVIAGNFIGTDTTGTLDLGNGEHGVVVRATQRTTVGGTAAGLGNVISGNGLNGVRVEGFDGPSGEIIGDDTVIVGNLIGTNAAGTGAIPNLANGIFVGESRHTVIGGAGAARNLVSGNGQNGVLLAQGLLTSPSTRHVVRGNLIGTTINADVPLPNSLHGIALISPTLVGLTNSLVEENTIRFNGSGGIVAQGGSRNRFLGNSLDGNGALGIDLAGNGVTPNDVLDADDGPNGLQNYPVLTEAGLVGGAVAVTGTFNSTPGRTFRIEFFSSPAPDHTGFGEGRAFLGFIEVMTDGTGNAAIAATLPLVPAGGVIAATATDLTARNTSEFSNALATPPAPILNVGDVNVVEGDAGTAIAVLRVDLSQPAGSDVTFQFATADGSASSPGDYTATTGTAVIPAGSLFTTISVPVIRDTEIEPDELFFVNVAMIVGAVGGDVQGEVRIENDDTAAAAAGIPSLSESALILMVLALAIVGAEVAKA